MKQHFTLVGSARALPARVVTAAELDRELALETGWTAQHTGVLERRRAASPAEMETLARRVCDEALRDAGMRLRDIDLIVDASLSLQQPIPCNAARVQLLLGAEAAGIPCIDVHASCLGFIAALNAVNGLFSVGAARRALIVCVESPLFGVNWREPESACLMGDGATAVVLAAEERAAPCCIRMETYAEGFHLCEVKGGGHRQPPMDFAEARRGDYLFHMDGKAVHHLASKRLPPFLRRVLEETGQSLAALDVVPHQASGPALELMRRRLGVATERFHVSIAEHGNLVAAGIPYVLDGVRRRRPRGAPVLLLGTAAGYTQAAALFAL
jgi:3-oxoacyl-[acyl-carrier-protein] synthase-3